MANQFLNQDTKTSYHFPPFLITHTGFVAAVKVFLLPEPRLPRHHSLLSVASRLRPWMTAPQDDKKLKKAYFWAGSMP